MGKRRTARQQRRLRAAKVASPLNIHVRVTVERLQGATLLSEATGAGEDLAAALWNARNRTKSMFREIGEVLADMQPAEAEEGSA